LGKETRENSSLSAPDREQPNPQRVQRHGQPPRTKSVAYVTAPPEGRT
jgi:hypothetical protein